MSSCMISAELGLCSGIVLLCSDFCSPGSMVSSEFSSLSLLVVLPFSCWVFFPIIPIPFVKPVLYLIICQVLFHPIPDIFFNSSLLLVFFRDISGFQRIQDLKSWFLNSQKYSLPQYPSFLHGSSGLSSSLCLLSRYSWCSCNNLFLISSKAWWDPYQHSSKKILPFHSS